MQQRVAYGLHIAHGWAAMHCSVLGPAACRWESGGASGPCLDLVWTGWAGGGGGGGGGVGWFRSVVGGVLVGRNGRNRLNVLMMFFDGRMSSFSVTVSESVKSHAKKSRARTPHGTPDRPRPRPVPHARLRLKGVFSPNPPSPLGAEPCVCYRFYRTPKSFGERNLDLHFVCVNKQ